MKDLKDGESCSHPGCLQHITHPCERCKRIAGIRKKPYFTIKEDGFSGKWEVGKTIPITIKVTQPKIKMESGDD